MKVQRLLLLLPPAITFKAERDINPLPPMGLGYIAAVAEAKGLEVRIKDCLAAGWDTEEELGNGLVRVGLSYAAISSLIKDFAPDIVGVSCHFSRQNPVYHQLFSLIRESAPSAVIVAGGAHATVCPEELLRGEGCDFVVQGEAEDSFARLLDGLRDGKDPSVVDGLAWSKEGSIEVNPKTEWIQDLDSIPFPAYHLMDLDLYFGLEASHGQRHRSRFAPVITSRGCPARCTFCSALKVWGKAYRFRSAANVMEEMKLLKNVYGIEEVMFEDDNVTANPARARALFSSMIDEDFGFVWDTPNGVGVWSMDEEMIDLMKRSGCIRLNFPVESGSQRVLREVIRKPLDLPRVERLIAHCRGIGLDYGMFLVIGMPGETLSEMWESFRFAAKCGCFDPHVSVATPYPGTELFELCLEKGYFSRPFSFDGLFIRSYILETPEWGERSLRLILLAGRVYLRGLHLLRDPKGALRRLRARLNKVMV